MCRKALKSFVQENDLGDKVKVIGKEADKLTSEDINQSKVSLLMQCLN